MGAQRRVNESGFWCLTRLASAAAPFLTPRHHAAPPIVRSTPQAPSPAPTAQTVNTPAHRQPQRTELLLALQVSAGAA